MPRPWMLTLAPAVAIVGLLAEGWTGDGAAGGVMVPQNPAVVGPYESEMRSYLNSVQTGAPVEVTLEDGLNAVSLCLAAIRSATGNCPVEMPA